ncbi:MAG TPA: hypothetical protein VG106_08180 [Vicinamibacterales bacterium]|nr:hypothetical protein [Vicinamibacterales bacterium]
MDRTNGETIVVFNVTSESDLDWLENAILQYDYYEQPGVWNLRIDSDKRVIAEIVASFAPARTIEVGCAAGAVIECLHESGIDAEGVEISSMAIQRASPRVRGRRARRHRPLVRDRLAGLRGG